jgi:putative ABC transport system ATP-binding protein
MKNAIVVRDVTKTYAEGGSSVAALRGVNLEVESGEIVMLMGPSGSGKTTLLSIMGCILQASSGSVQIAGREVVHLQENDLPQVRREHIGFVFQSFNLFPTLTAGENVELMLDVKGVRGAPARRRAYQLLESVGVADKFDVLPANLSGGQKQRVAIARALAGDPAIILADEPTAALDSQTGRSVMEILRSLAHERGRAVVIVTHDPRVIEFADRTIRIEDGLIVPDEVEAAVLPQLPAQKRTSDAYEMHPMAEVLSSIKPVRGQINAIPQNGIRRALPSSIHLHTADSTCFLTAWW